MPTLSWLTRDEDLKAAGRAPYRLLQEVPELGHGDPHTGNMLIQGDNLEALKSLLPFYAGQVKCIYIDPPYNTGSAFEHYDDSLEHSRWLAMMWPRLELLRELLSEDGSIWVSIDDNEGHYLKVIMDEVFGRKNFVANVVWQKKYAKQNDASTLSMSHDHILCFARNMADFTPRKLERSEKQLSSYKNPDNDPRGPWQSVVYTCSKTRKERPNLFYPITHPVSGAPVLPSETRVWGYDEAATARNIAENRLWWGENGELEKPRKKSFLAEVKAGVVADTIWLRDEVGDNQDAKREALMLNSDDVFGTPKPERLMQRIFQVATNPGDLVLDSFLGSGTTAAVAQKMGRRYIGIEVGEHAVTHCQPRLNKVVDGEQGGISKAHSWTGGGGFRFWRLGPPVFDDTGRLTADIAFDTLASHVWFSEMNQPLVLTTKGPLLGVQGDRAVALLYNGVLGDKRPAGGNVLTRQTLAIIREGLPSDFDGDLIVYGERSALTPATLARERIAFRQTPYDVKARR